MSLLSIFVKQWRSVNEFVEYFCKAMEEYSIFLFGFLFGLACGLIAMCIVGIYYSVKINDLKLKYKIWEE